MKVALVTGSASGIGANVAIDLAANGYFIVITGRNQDKLDKVVARCNEISSPGKISATSFVADLMDLEQVDMLVQFIKSKFKRLDVLINNACWRGDQYRNILSTDNNNYDNNLAFDDFKKVMHINVSIPMYLIQQCLAPMSRLQNDAAVVINVSSIASQVVVPLHTYSISKACLSEMSHQLSKMSQTIHTVTISPGPILTDERPHHSAMSNMTLMNRVGSTQEISNLILFAIQNARLFNGQELNIDGGYTAKQRQVSNQKAND